MVLDQSGRHHQGTRGCSPDKGPVVRALLANITVTDSTRTPCHAAPGQTIETAGLKPEVDGSTPSLTTSFCQRKHPEGESDQVFIPNQTPHVASPRKMPTCFPLPRCCSKLQRKTEPGTVRRIDRPKPCSPDIRARDGRQHSKPFSRNCDAEPWLRNEEARIDAAEWVVLVASRLSPH